MCRLPHVQARRCPKHAARRCAPKWSADFDAADTERKGSITRDQARAARLAVVHDNFDAIDGARKGRVTFEDYKRFLRARGARTL